MKTVQQTLKYSGIYCIINIVNNKRYVGSSKNIYQRLLKHRAYLRHNYHQNPHLQSSWNKYGEQSFDYYILEKCSEQELIQKEQFYIDSLNAEYNITKIVERNILSKESRLKQSETRKRKIRSGELILNTSREVHQYNLKGEFLNSFKSIRNAAKFNNLHVSTIHRYLQGKYKQGKGSLWSYTKEINLPEFKKEKRNMSSMYKPVIVSTEEIIMEFKSIKECAKYFKVTSATIGYVLRHSGIYKNIYKIVYKLPNI